MKNNEIVITCKEIKDKTIYHVGELIFSSKKDLLKYLDEKLKNGK